MSVSKTVTNVESQTRPKTRKVSARGREAIAFYLFVTPFIVGFLVFSVGPILASLGLSFTRWNMFTPAQWVGFHNYKELLTNDNTFWIAVWNTTYYVLISIPLGICLSLILAVLLNQPIMFRRWIRAAFYLPSTIPVVASVMLWMWLLAPAGLINEVLAVFGIKGPAWFVNPVWFKPGLILMSLWGAGAGTVLFLAGLQGIPTYLYEASAIEGASKIRQFFTITIPMLSPIILFNLVMGIIGGFQVFTQVYIVGINNADIMLEPYLFETAFQNFDMGYASALAWVMFIIIIALTLVVLKWSAVWVYYEGEVRE